MVKNSLLGVNIDTITLSQAADQIELWIKEGTKRSIVTPNIEFIMLAQRDQKFRKLLNQADLAIPDSARFGWAIAQTNQKNLFLRLLEWPLFLVPAIYAYPTTTGTDLMQELVKRSCEKGYRIGLFGSVKSVADRLSECLRKDCEKIKLDFVKSDLVVDNSGNMLQYESLRIPKLDILFVALGQGKQEKWIANYSSQYPATISIGVGGAFDYLSNSVPRAPKVVRAIGFEWLFRLILQPWRIKRFGSLVQFILRLLINPSK